MLKLLRMRNYNKKTLALILASAITIAGSFASERYKNSIMNIEFSTTGSNSISTLIQMKSKYDSAITPVKTAPNTYVITLPDINSEIGSEPRIDDNIKSVDIRTMPYTTNGNGYTKIVIKTNQNKELTVKSAVYIPQKTVASIAPSQDKPDDKVSAEGISNVPNSPVTSQTTSTEQQVQTKKKQTAGDTESKKVIKVEKPIVSSVNAKSTNSSNSSKATETVKTSVEKKSSNAQKNHYDQGAATGGAVQFILGALIVMVLVLVLFIAGKKKMAEVVGQASDFDFDDEPDIKQKKKAKAIKNTINKIDRKFSNRAPVNLITGEIGKESSNDLFEESTETNKKVETKEPMVIVDLDELYTEKSKETQVENSAVDEIITELQENESVEDADDDLADLLNAFSFGDVVTAVSDSDIEEIENQALYNELLYDEIISSDSLEFDNTDIQKIQKLLNSEISDEMINEVNEYMSNPLNKNKKLPKEKILENFITTYTLERDIIFTQKDIEALNKLISVEIDPSFVKDLRTNIQPKPSKKTKKKSSKKEEQPNVSLLSVKDLLPDLSLELQRLGGKEIPSEARTDVVYFSEGYEVSTLSVSSDFKNMDFKNKENSFRPSDQIELVADGFQYETLKVDNFIPDLEDVKKNPQRYQEEEKNTYEEVSEEALLERITNVTFKPFYEGEDNIEEPEEDLQEDVILLTPEEIRAEFAQFEGFEIVEESNEEVLAKEVNVKQANEDAKKLLEAIEQQKLNKINKKTIKNINKVNSNKTVDTKEQNEVLKEVVFGKCIINNKDYHIIKSCEITDNTGIYIGQNANEFLLIGFIDNNYFGLKEFDKLNVNKIQLRLLKKIAEDKKQYIVKIDKKKFIIEVSNDSMEFVMEL